MQRLTRQDRERGAVAIWVAILMVPLMMAAALAIDISAMHTDRQRLQYGADAGALAIAQQCSVAPCAFAAADDVAQRLAEENAPMGTLPHARAALSSGWVEVRNESDREFWFANVLGSSGVSISTSSAASWGYPTGGAAVMPFAFSWCELAVQAGLPVIRNSSGQVSGIQIPEAGVTRTVLASKKSDSGCTGPSGNIVPGGFGWLEPTDGCGDTVTDIESWAPSDPGNSPPHGCSPTDFSKWVGQTILLPVFDVATGNGNNAKYSIFGYVAFRLEAYYFAGQFVTSDRPCSGDERCMRGTFLRYADLESDFEYSAGGPQLGAAVVELRLPRGGVNP